MANHDELPHSFEICIQKVDAFKQQLQMNPSLQFYSQFVIPSHQSGFSYERIFKPFLDSTVTKVYIEDPYIRMSNQCLNFARFCNVVRKFAPNTKLIILKTVDEPEATLKREQFGCLSNLTTSLKLYGIDLQVIFEKDLHDREIKFDNGWMIKIGRGLDYFKMAFPCTIESIDLDECHCRRTCVDVIFNAGLHPMKIRMPKNGNSGGPDIGCQQKMVQHDLAFLDNKKETKIIDWENKVKTEDLRNLIDAMTKSPKMDTSKEIKPIIGDANKKLSITAGPGATGIDLIDFKEPAAIKSTSTLSDNDPMDLLIMDSDQLSINCQICHTKITWPKQFNMPNVVQCQLCGERTPIRSPPNGMVYHRCTCAALVFCAQTAKNVHCTKKYCGKTTEMNAVLVQEISDGNQKKKDYGLELCILLEVGDVLEMLLDAVGDVVEND